MPYGTRARMPSAAEGMPDPISDEGMPDPISDEGMPDPISDEGMPDEGMPDDGVPDPISKNGMPDGKMLRTAVGRAPGETCVVVTCQMELPRSDACT